MTVGLKNSEAIYPVPLPPRFNLSPSTRNKKKKRFSKIFPVSEISPKSPESEENRRTLTNSEMGISINADASSSMSRSHYNVHKFFLFGNYILLGAASSCIFLTLSLRLVPSPCGFFIIFLHIFTIASAVSGCAMASAGTGRWFGVHMVFTVLTAIFQGSVAVLIYTRTGDFLGELKSYVREEDGSVILKLAGGLSILIFCLEWVVLVLAFFLKYYAYVEGNGGSNGVAMKRSAKVQQDEGMKNWPWPSQV